MNDAKSFVLDLWSDLRARRLWPVAVVLLVGVVAAPVLLSKKAAEPAPQTPATAASASQPQERKGPAALAEVKLDELTEGTGSSLSAFDQSNPFSPPEKVLAAARREALGDTGTTTTPPDTGTTGGTTDGSTGGDTTGGTDTPDTGGDGGGDTTKTTEFTYVLDVTFWANGRKRTIEGMEKLDMLPSEVAPLLIFMGVTDSAGNAVFLVDSTLATAGEGKCKPSQDECAFLYLGAGSEQEFTNDDGDSYRLLVNEIRKVKVGDEADKASSAKKSKSSKSARAAVGATAPARRFALPALTDIVVESVGGNDDSTGAAERR